MIHETEAGAATWQPHNDVRLSARVEAALNARLPGWPPPLDCIDDVPESSVEVTWTIDHPGFVTLRRGSIRLLVPLLGALEDRHRVVSAEDNAAAELTALARRGDEAGFRALAVCVMPLEEVGECWAGARGRLGLPT